MSGFGLSRGCRVDKGQYLLTQRLGSGGMGEVWEAFDQQLHRHVALKFLQDKRSGYSDEPRVVIEARHTLLHEHIVRVYGLGKLNENVPFLVMERLVGRTLHDDIRARGRLSVAQAANVLLPIICAIGVAHAARIVHRDVKPRNIFLEVRPDGTVSSKLLDFGISKRLIAGNDASVEPSGTRGYRSPEQIGVRGRLDLATDTWALGLVLYECLVGERFWEQEEADDAMMVASVMASKMQSALSKLPTDTPLEIVGMIQEALQVDPAARMTLERMYEALLPYATIAVPSFLPPVATSGMEYENELAPPSDDVTRTKTKTSPSTRSNAGEIHADQPMATHQAPEERKSETRLHFATEQVNRHSLSGNRSSHGRTSNFVYTLSLVGLVAMLIGFEEFISKSRVEDATNGIDSLAPVDADPVTAAMAEPSVHPWLRNRYLSDLALGISRLGRPGHPDGATSNAPDSSVSTNNVTRRIALSDQQTRPVVTSSSTPKIEKTIDTANSATDIGESAAKPADEPPKGHTDASPSQSKSRLKTTPRGFADQFGTKTRPDDDAGNH